MLLLQAKKSNLGSIYANWSVFFFFFFFNFQFDIYDRFTAFLCQQKNARTELAVDALKQRAALPALGTRSPGCCGSVTAVGECSQDKNSNRTRCGWHWQGIFHPPVWSRFDAQVFSGRFGPGRAPDEAAQSVRRTSPSPAAIRTGAGTPEPSCLNPPAMAALFKIVFIIHTTAVLGAGETDLIN